MSGGDFTGGGGFTEINSCDKLVINTQISSPKEDVIAGLSVGSLLDVGLQEAATTIVVLMHEGKIAGGVTAATTNQLIKCLRDNNNYVAQVKSINDGQVKVRISPTN